MPFTAADASEKVTALQTKPADLEALTVTELSTGLDIQDHILKSDFRLSPTASATHNDTPLGAKGTHTNFAEGTAEGTITPFRDLDETGRPVPDSDTEAVFDLVKEKGSELWIAVRKGPDPDEPWAAGDEYSVYHVTTDTPQDPSDRGGWIKYVVPLGVSEFERFKKVVAAGG